MDFEWLFSRLGCESCQREGGGDEEGSSHSMMFKEKHLPLPSPLVGLHGSSSTPMSPPRDDRLEKARKDLIRIVRDIETGGQKLRAAMQV
jgi:hypothetical protein